MDQHHAEIEVRLAKAKVMEILRALPLQVREITCKKLQYNAEFCWNCGIETPDGRSCQCENADEIIADKYAAL